MLTVAGVIVLVVAPALIIGAGARCHGPARTASRHERHAGEVLNAIPVVQSFTQEQAEADRFRTPTSGVRHLGATHRTRPADRLRLIGVFGSLLYGLHGGEGVLDGRSPRQLSQTSLYIMLALQRGVLAEVWGDLLRAAAATDACRSCWQPPRHPGSAQPRAAAD